MRDFDESITEEERRQMQADEAETELERREWEQRMGGYKVYRLANGEPKLHAQADGKPLTHVAMHSPTGFEVGYPGSGPADLALAILIHHFRAPTDRVEYHRPRWQMDPRARKAWCLHQIFKRHFVAVAPREGFSLTSREIADWLRTEEPRKILEAVEAGD